MAPKRVLAREKQAVCRTAGAGRGLPVCARPSTMRLDPQKICMTATEAAPVRAGGGGANHGGRGSCGSISKPSQQTIFRLKTPLNASRDPLLACELLHHFSVMSNGLLRNKRVRAPARLAGVPRAICGHPSGPHLGGAWSARRAWRMLAWRVLPWAICEWASMRPTLGSPSCSTPASTGRGVE